MFTSGWAVSRMQRSGLVDLEEGQIRSACDVEQDAPGSVDGNVEQLARNGLFGGDAGAVLTGGFAHCHQRRAAFAHDGAHVCEVQVDQAGDGDEFGDALDALAQHFVSDLERVRSGWRACP